MGDGITASMEGLEDAVTIAIITFFHIKNAQTSVREVHTLHLSDKLGSLGTISPDVLDCRRTHLARNERQVFQSVPPLGKAVFHPAVPVHSGSHSHQHLLIFLSKHLYALNGRMKDNTGEILHEK